MHRRAILRTVGLWTAVATAGCLGSDSTDDGEEPSGTDDTAGYDVDTDGSDAADGGEEAVEAANEFDYSTMTVEGIEVPLVPNEDAFEWFEDGETVFVDARTREEYERARIPGAVFSPARDGLSTDDPVEELSTDTRIVTYCACPHTLAGLRAASLLRDGYEHTYALAEGIPRWDEAGYPIESS